MKTRQFFTASLLLIALIFASGSELYAQRGNGQGMRQGMNYCQNIPNLTDKQSDKLTDLQTEHQKKMLNYRNQLNEKQAKLRTLQSESPAKLTTINKTIDELGDIRTDMAKERAAHRQAVRSELSEEQRTWYDSHHARRGQGYGRGNGQGYGRGNGQGRCWR